MYSDSYSEDIASAAISAEVFDIPNSSDIADKHGELPETVLYDIAMERLANRNYTTA